MSVAGKWQISMDTPIGTQKFTWDLQEAGGAWKGTMSAPNGSSELGNVQVSGSNVGCNAGLATHLGNIVFVLTTLFTRPLSVRTA
jgi:hypothetical protein